MVFNATFNNISIISWRSVLLVEKTGVPVENQRPVASHSDKIYIMDIKKKNFRNKIIFLKIKFIFQKQN
jgi:hypothetical protein